MPTPHRTASILAALLLVAAVGEGCAAVPARPTGVKLLRASLARAVAAVPAPPAPYQLLPEYSEQRVEQAAAESLGGRVSATAERYYEVPEDTPVTALPIQNRELVGPIEVTVCINGPVDLPGLGSLAAYTTRLTVPGAEAALVAALPPMLELGRMAAMRPEEADYRLCSAFILVGDRPLEAALRDLIAHRNGGSRLKALAARPGGRAEAPRWITVFMHGPKAGVERAARGIRAQNLRRLLVR